MKQRVFALAVGAVLLSCLFAAVRDLGGAPEIRRQLVGTWELAGVINAGVELPTPTLPGDTGSLRMTLHADGNVTYPTYPVADGHLSTWSMVDRRHFQIVHRFPPNPEVPGMADGATEEEEHEIVSLSPDRLVVLSFDGDTGPFDFIYKTYTVYKRVGPSPHLD